MFYKNIFAIHLIVTLCAVASLSGCNKNTGSQSDVPANGRFSSATPPQQLDPKNIVLLKSNMSVQIPEQSFAPVNPEQLRMVDERSLNEKVMPNISKLTFFSHNRQKNIPIPYEKIQNNCFARRTAMDAYLWFGEPLHAKQEERVEPDLGNPFVTNATITKHRYLLHGFERPDFKDTAWVETARINVIGKLETGDVSWMNHETVVVNTQNGVRVIDPSFDKTKALKVEDWLRFFAPDGKCTALKSQEEAAEITQAIILTTNFKESWPANVPLCGYSFHQRLDSRDIETNTAWSFGNNREEIFLSAKFRTYFEEKLQQ